MPDTNPLLFSTEEGTAIQNKYTFWCYRSGNGTKRVDYIEATKPIGSFGTVEGFWHVYDHIIRPNDFKQSADYHLFKEGIKPTWEDPANKAGGKWMVRLKTKGLTSRYWEELVLAIIGEQFDVGHEICKYLCHSTPLFFPTKKYRSNFLSISTVRRRCGKRKAQRRHHFYLE